jgi:hypothetical protein
VVEGPFLGNVFVMEKQAGWGDTLGISVVNQNTAGCFECHVSRAKLDFTFNYVTNLKDRGK